MISFKLKNVKSFIETQHIDLKPLNIFVGRNSSGKSSLIRFPVMLSQTFKEDVYTPFLLFGSLIDYGNFDDVIYNHVGNSMTFGFTFDPKEIRGLSKNSILFSRDSSEVMSNFWGNIKELGIEVEVVKTSRKIFVKQFDLIVNKKVVASIELEGKRKYRMILSDNVHTLEENVLPVIIYPEIDFNKFIPSTNLQSVNLIFDTMKEIYIKDPNCNDLFIAKIEQVIGEREIPSIKLFEQYFEDVMMTRTDKLFLDVLERYYAIFYFTVSTLRGVSRSISNFSNQISYIGPFRKDPERTYRESENSYKNVGKFGENSSMLLRQAQQSKSQLLDKVSNWLRESTGYRINIEDVDNSNLFRVMVYADGSEIGNNIIDVGYGIAQVLPIVTQLYLESNTLDFYRRITNNTYIIEQPELHLHPAAQANLADLFVEKIINTPGTRMLVESHSEHLIRKIQVLVADPEVDFTHNDVAIYYVDKTEQGNSIIRNLQMDENGQFIAEWPTGFFDKSYELSRELLKIARKRNEK